MLKISIFSRNREKYHLGAFTYLGEAAKAIDNVDRPLDRVRRPAKNGSKSH